MVCTLLLLVKVHNYYILWLITTNIIVVFELGTLSVSNDACQCKFLSTMKLPCRDMFAVHEKEGVSLLSARDIPDRWKMSYLQQVFRIMKQQQMMRLIK